MKSAITFYQIQLLSDQHSKARWYSFCLSQNHYWGKCNQPFDQRLYCVWKKQKPNGTFSNMNDWSIQLSVMRERELCSCSSCMFCTNLDRTSTSGQIGPPGPAPKDLCWGCCKWANVSFFYNLLSFSLMFSLHAFLLSTNTHGDGTVTKLHSC